MNAPKFVVRLPNGNYYNPFFGEQPTKETASKVWTREEADYMAAKCNGTVEDL